MYNQLYEKWYRPLILMFIGFIVAFFVLSIRREIALNISIVLLIISPIIPLVFGIISLARKDYLRGALQTVLAIVFGFATIGFFSFTLLFYPSDFFAEGIEIPQNIKFEKPIDLNGENPVPSITEQNIVLVDDLQPGIYRYDIYLKNIEKGSVYLKIYESTQNQLLSEKEIQKNSKIEIEKPSQELKKFSLKNHFTVYEGDWGQFYGSRVEVWFVTSNKTQKERKLFEKNYIIQGWQR